MSGSGPAPVRSPEQVRKALALANTTRLYRAQLKRDIKAGRVDALEVLRNPHPLARRMPVIELLLAMPRVGTFKANQVLYKSGTAPSKTLIGLTYRQVEAIAVQVGLPMELNRRRAA